MNSKKIVKNIFFSWQGKDLPRLIIWDVRNYSAEIYSGYKKVGTVWADPSEEEEGENEEHFRFKSLTMKRVFREEGRGMKQLFRALRESYHEAYHEYLVKHSRYSSVFQREFAFN